MKKLEIGLMAALLLFPAIGTAEAYTAETLKPRFPIYITRIQESIASN